MIDLAKTPSMSRKNMHPSVYGFKAKSHLPQLGATLINDDFDVSKPYLVPKRTKLNNNLPSVWKYRTQRFILPM
jgi:hypothetical protein